MINIFEYETHLWKRLMQNDLYKKFYNHIFIIHHYDDYICNNYPYIFNGQQQIFNIKSNTNIPRSFSNFITTILTIIMLLETSLYSFFPDFFDQFLFTRTLPNMIQTKRYAMSVCAIWSTSILLQYYYGFSTIAEQFGFLHIFHLDNNHIGRLNNLEIRQLKFIRNFMHTIIRFITIFIVILVIIVVGLKSIEQYESTLLSLFITIFWYFGIVMHAFYVCSVMYHIPIVIIIVQHYLEIKQKSLKTRIKHYHQQLFADKSRIHHNFFWKWHFGKAIKDILSIYEQQLKEIHIHNKQLTKILSILFTSLIWFFTYGLNIICLIPLSKEFLFLYVTITLAHLTVLIMLINRCSRIEQQNHKILRLKQKFQIHSSFEGGMLSVKNSIKLNGIISAFLDRSFGFELINGVCIKQITFINVFTNISFFFFLIAPHVIRFREQQRTMNLELSM
ncbi:uncharacterized protein LOC113789310 [Dermatophagoides pteronyssinus]|uniref:uncharacterized protein LOC113789310 n=1 Tax=Dermatophagoides pteronyssinus TaxID=6956 RepID=UPI003F67EC17